jgi:hypothetical protein
MMHNQEIAAMLGTALEIYTLSRRRSGRTGEILDRLKDRDTLITFSAKHAELLRRDCRERGLPGVEIIHVEAGAGQALAMSLVRKRNGGRVFVDHTWIEAYYIAEIASASRRLASMVKAYSIDPAVEERPSMQRFSDRGFLR